LPLYLTLLLVTPLLIWVGMRRPYLLLAASVLVWLLAGQFRINLPNYPNPGGWFFNPLSWQIIFVLGLLTGIFLKRGERFVPRIGWLLWLCGAWLIATIVWKHVPGVGPAANRFMAELGRAGVPFYVVSFDKTFVAVLRLSHFLALAYVLSCFSWV